jgi:hypothetical protein
MNHQTQTHIMKVQAERIQPNKKDKDIYMRTIPTCYYTPSILKLIDDCIYDGYSAYSSLLLCDRERITAECLSELGSDSFDAAINLEEMLEYFIEVLKTGKSEISMLMVNSMRMTSTEYFEDVMDQLFSERRQLIKNNKLRDFGFVPDMDNETGETFWRKAI